MKPVPWTVALLACASLFLGCEGIPIEHKLGANAIARVDRALESLESIDLAAGNLQDSLEGLPDEVKDILEDLFRKDVNSIWSPGAIGNQGKVLVDYFEAKIKANLAAAIAALKGARQEILAAGNDAEAITAALDKLARFEAKLAPQIKTYEPPVVFVNSDEKGRRFRHDIVLAHGWGLEGAKVEASINGRALETFNMGAYTSAIRLPPKVSLTDNALIVSIDGVVAHKLPVVHDKYHPAIFGNATATGIPFFVPEGFSIDVSGVTVRRDGEEIATGLISSENAQLFAHNNHGPKKTATITGPLRGELHWLVKSLGYGKGSFERRIFKVEASGDGFIINAGGTDRGVASTFITITVRPAEVRHD